MGADLQVGPHLQPSSAQFGVVLLHFGLNTGRMERVFVFPASSVHVTLSLNFGANTNSLFRIHK